MIKCFYPVQTDKCLRPCGQCAACLVSKQLSWKFRLNQEVLKSDAAFWLTLQYDDEHLPRSNGIPCVDKLHCQNYFRQIRKYLERYNLKVTFKYFLTAEYGPTTNRPHYHALLLFKLPVSSFNEMLALRQRLYDTCKERWYHGHCQESLFHRGVINYLTKYVFKPQKDFDPPVPLFRLISKGIGEEYLQDINSDEILMSDFKTPYGVLPRYYRDKLFPTSKVNPVGIKNALIRQDKFNDLLSKKYINEFRQAKNYGSIDSYIKRQHYLFKCQKELSERKQKQKYG